MKRKTSCLVLFCFVALLAGCVPDKASVAEDKLIGDQIVAALEKYKAEQGSYPDVLSQLEPTYISHITPPHYGERRWDYIHYCTNDSFGLAIWGRRLTDDGYLYSSERKKWQVAENTF